MFRCSFDATFLSVSSLELATELAVLPHTIAARVRIVIEHGRIATIDTERPSPNARFVAGTLLPGLVDLQVNGGGGSSCAEATPAALATVARAVLDGGAVAFLPTLITTPWDQLLAQVAATASWIESQPDAGATPLGMHVEGPFLEVAGAHDRTALLEPSLPRIEALLQAARGHLRLLTLASSRPGAAAAVARLRQAGVTVALGHVAQTDGFAACVDAGAAMATHLFNAMGPLHHRQPGIAGLSLDEDRLACGLIADGVHVHPAMLRNAYRVLGPDRTVLVSDSTAAMGMPDGIYQLANESVQSSDGVVRDRNGNLAGSALTMARAAQNFLLMVPMAGSFALARAAATNPAALVGANEFGAIAVGKRAAFAVLADDGSVRALRC